jgi:hypothetical protein
MRTRGVPYANNKQDILALTQRQQLVDISRKGVALSFGGLYEKKPKGELNVKKALLAR